MDEQQKKTLAALYAHWSRRAEAVGPERDAHWLGRQVGLREALEVLGFEIVPDAEFPGYSIVEKTSG